MKTTLLLLFSFVYITSFGQYNRYKDSTAFNDYNLTSDIQYGSNIDLNGKNQNLFLDLYEPKRDTLKLRPLIIMAFGGGFVTGNRKEDYITGFSRIFAKTGYVTASIDYRIGIKSQFSLTDQASAIYRGTQDFKCAVRFFVKNAKKYGIDTSRIYAGGFSAGSISAIHAAYWEEHELISLIDTNKLGGLNNATGNQGYPLKIRAVINCFGAIIDTNWIKKGNAPMVSLHGDKDNVVPYKSISIGGFGLYGSWSLNERLKHLGNNTLLHTYYGKGHALGTADSLEMDTLIQVVRDFLVKDISSPLIVTGIERQIQSKSKFVVYQNRQSLNFKEIEDLKEINIFSTDGRLVYKSQFADKEINLGGEIIKTQILIVKAQSKSGEIFTNKVFWHSN